MYCYNKTSHHKIIHLASCFHLSCKPENIGYFSTLEEAYRLGYRLCKHCDPLCKCYTKEKQAILDFSQKYGFSVYLGHKCIFITSVRSKWRIISNQNGDLVLYHKNLIDKDNDTQSVICGYHFQGDVSKNSIIEYLNYILDHDHFRMLNPVHIPKSQHKLPPQKGTKRYKSTQRRNEKLQRKKDINNVLNIIDSLRIASNPSAIAV